jgi:hypothetical protein
MLTYLRYTILIILVLAIGSAHADILCAKKSQKVSKNSVAISSALKVSSAVCPSGYSQILDTSSFKGDTGDTGATGPAGAQGVQGDAGPPAIAHSTCQRRQLQFTRLFNSVTTQLNSDVATCQAGEYAHAVKIVESRVYSNDWSEDSPSDTSKAGTSPSDTFGKSPDVYDSEELFLVGAKTSQYYFYPPVVGTVSVTVDVYLTCCLLGD